MRPKAAFLCLTLLTVLLVPPECFPQDFGFILDQKLLVAEGEDSSGAREYTGTVMPWFSAPLGTKADLYFSCGVSARLEDEEWKALPELHRFEFIYNPLPQLRFEAGRVAFKESLSFVAAGLFDGISAGLNTRWGRLSGGLFYTGLLYKKTAYIYMSPEDRIDFSDKDVYFASRRLLGGINWEKTSVFDTRNGLSLSALCQIDLNRRDSYFHSQYLEAKITMPLGSAFNTLFGAVFELAEETGRNYAAFAFSTEAQWLLPTALSDMLTVRGRFSSGDWNEGWGAFIPLSAEAQGKTLRPMLSGIALAEAAYTARLRRSLATDISGAYFFRTDKTTYMVPDRDADSSSPFLGAEIYGALSWTPFSDVLLSLGAGIFLPGTGGFFLDEAGPKYRAELTASISL
jgi:hypothetical protein